MAQRAKKPDLHTAWNVLQCGFNKWPILYYSLLKKVRKISKSVECKLEAAALTTFRGLRRSHALTSETLIIQMNVRG